MGNVDACSKDDELVRMFEENNGPVNETAWQFFSRSYTKFCNSIVNPRRWSYETEQLISNGYTRDIFPWNVTEFKVFSQGNTLHCCFWNLKEDGGAGMSSTTASTSAKQHIEPPSRLCIVYLHTNQRSLYDVHEIIPVAKRLKASILSFDLPGCGKSEGSLNGTMDADVEHLLEWAQCLVGADVRIVLWARGMSTALAITLGARLSKLKKAGNPAPYTICCMVLDSPFTAIDDMVKTAIDRMHNKGYTLTKSLLKLFIKRTAAKLASQMNGLNVFEIKPLKYAKDNIIPAFFLTATNDDYIPSEHSVIISKKWGAPVQLSFFDGRHYSIRPEDVNMRPYDFIYFYTVTAFGGSQKAPPPPPVILNSSSPIPEDIAEDSQGLKGIIEVEDIQVGEEETEEELLAIIQGKVDPISAEGEPSEG